MNPLLVSGPTQEGGHWFGFAYMIVGALVVLAFAVILLLMCLNLPVEKTPAKELLRTPEEKEAYRLVEVQEMRFGLAASDFYRDLANLIPAGYPEWTPATARATTAVLLHPPTIRPVWKRDRPSVSHTIAPPSASAPIVRKLLPMPTAP
ncbi:MAG: hypothetical protein P4L46_02865 [Fimbriimonas sp.]|nr:hypothetical protein [Fimbriimonas sp.]